MGTEVGWPYPAFLPCRNVGLQCPENWLFPREAGNLELFPFLNVGPPCLCHIKYTHGPEFNLCFLLPALSPPGFCADSSCGLSKPQGRLHNLVVGGLKGAESGLPASTSPSD